MPRIDILNGSRAGTSVDLGPGEAYEVGATPSAGLHLEDPGVDDEHARILDTGGGYVVVDLGSQGGTSVNGARLAVQTAHTLQAGDEIVVGDVRMSFVETQRTIPPTVALGPPLQLEDGDDGAEPAEEPAFDETIFVAPPTDDPLPEATGRRGGTKRMKPVEEAPPVTGGPTQAELDEALRGVEESIAAARSSCEQRVAQARKTVQAAQARFHQATQDQRAALDEARAEAEELREQLEELNEDLIAISDERDKLLDELERLGGGEG